MFIPYNEYWDGKNLERLSAPENSCLGRRVLLQALFRPYPVMKGDVLYVQTF
jgi:hypothetical protein